MTDDSSDSETDSEIRTEREKDIELASSHSSDDDEAIPPLTLSSIKPVMSPNHGQSNRQPVPFCYKRDNKKTISYTTIMFIFFSRVIICCKILDLKRVLSLSWVVAD